MSLAVSSTKFSGNLLSSAAIAAAGEALRIPGRFSRLYDMQGAPDPDRNQVAKREGIAALSSFGFMFVTNLAAPYISGKLNLTHSRQEAILRAGLTVMGTILSEVAGRLGSHATYQDLSKNIQAPLQNKFQQIIQFLSGKPSIDHPTFSSTGPNTTVNPANFGRTPNATIISSPTFYSSHPYLRNNPSAFSKTPYLT